MVVPMTLAKRTWVGLLTVPPAPVATPMLVGSRNDVLAHLMPRRRGPICRARWLFLSHFVFPGIPRTFIIGCRFLRFLGIQIRDLAAELYGLQLQPRVQIEIVCSPDHQVQGRG